MLSSISSSLGRSAHPVQDPSHQISGLPGQSNYNRQNWGMQPSGSQQPYSGNQYPQPNQAYQPVQGSSGGGQGQGQMMPYSPQYSGQPQPGQSQSQSQPGSRTVQPWSNQPQSQPQQSQMTQYSQRYSTSGSGFSTYASSANLLGTNLGPQPLEEYRSGDDPVYGPLAKARAKVERGHTGDVEISPDLFDLMAQTNERPYVDLPSPSPAYRPVKIVRNLPLPDALHQELNYKHLTARMGLFEDIDRAWFAVDNRLFLWDYTDGRDFNRYDEQADTIISVGLVKARKDVFVDTITYILIICTATKVTLIGVSRPSAHELNLYATNLSAVLPTAILQIKGTSSGRVFMRGENKDIYELEYSSDSSWLFGSGAKVRVVNKTTTGLAAVVPSVFGSGGKEGIEDFTLDPISNRLYTLHTSGELNLIDVSGSNYLIRNRHTRLHADLFTIFNRMNPNTRPDPAAFKVVSMAPVQTHESGRIGLVVFAANGWRAYLDILSFSQGAILRKPPVDQPIKLETSTFYSSGTVFAVQNDSTQPTPSNILHIITPHSGRLAAAKENGYQDQSAANLAEWHTTESISSQVWTIAEVPATNPASSPLSLLRNNGIALSPLARQATTEARSFVILTTGGIYFAVQSRPMDLLSESLESERDAADVIGSNFGRIQLAAMSITLGSLNIKNQDISSSLSQIMHNALAPQIIQGATGRSIIFSSRHDGLALTLGRLLRPIWDLRVTAASTPGRQVLACAQSLLLESQGRLEQLRRYLDDNPFPRMQAEGDIKLAWDQEELSVEGLKKLLKQAIEAISFILLLDDYRITEIIARCDAGVQQTLSNLTWKDLICTTTGRDVAKRLVTALIEQQIGQELGIDTLSEILQQRCGTFVQPGDVVLYKAEESMRRAENSRDPVERSESLAEALRLFSRAGPAIFPRIGEITKRMRALQYAPGAIELGLSCAASLDPQDRALDYVHDGRYPQDARKEFYEQRMECYSCVIETLATYDESLNKAINGGGLVDAAEAKRDDAYSLAINSDDELFHFYLYDWQVSTNRQEQLLEFATPFIERYLQETSSDVEDRRDLLWKYYARSGEYLLAAKALNDLATRQSPMSLTDRVFYLAQSLASAKSAASLGADDVEFIGAVQERLDVAQVQQEVGRGIEGHPDMTQVEKDEVLAKLNTILLGLDELYQSFARPFRLYEPILLILKTADTRVDDVCEAVWRQLLQSAAEGPTPQAAMREKIVELFRRYFPSEAAPLDIVIRVVYGEAMHLSSGAEEGWATRALLEGGVPMRECWEVAMISHDEAEMDEEREFYTEEAGILAEMWVNDRESIHLAEVERFVSAYLLRTQAGQADDRRRRTRERMSKAKAAVGRW